MYPRCPTNFSSQYIHLQYLGIDMLSRHDKLKAQRQDVIATFQRHGGDAGSPEVMGKSLPRPLTCSSLITHLVTCHTLMVLLLHSAELREA